MDTLLAPSVEQLSGTQDGWSVAMCWRDLLFAHWPVRSQALRSLIPSGLEIDTFDGWAWIGIVPFHLTIRYRWMPLSLSFPEVNVRTYVRCGTERGVMFLSLDAESRLAVMVARRQYGLPYHVARMTMRRTISVASRSPDHDTGCERAGSGDPRTTECADGPRVCFVSRRRSRCGLPAELQADYGPTSEEFTAEAGSLDHWLIERYQLFTVDRHRRLAHGIIYHLPWRLQAAEADFQINRLVEPLGLRLPPELPLLHFARETNAVAWRLQGAHTSAGQLIEQ